MLFILIVVGLVGWAFWQFDNSDKISERRNKKS
jgi:hypothetical protein